MRTRHVGALIIAISLMLLIATIEPRSTVATIPWPELHTAEIESESQEAPQQAVHVPTPVIAEVANTEYMDSISTEKAYIIIEGKDSCPGFKFTWSEEHYMASLTITETNNLNIQMHYSLSGFFGEEHLTLKGRLPALNSYTWNANPEWRLIDAVIFVENPCGAGLSINWKPEIGENA